MADYPFDCMQQLLLLLLLILKQPMQQFHRYRAH
jgi:hypothetical protein